MFSLFSRLLELVYLGSSRNSVVVSAYRESKHQCVGNLDQSHLASLSTLEAEALEASKWALIAGQVQVFKLGDWAVFSLVCVGGSEVAAGGGSLVGEPKPFQRLDAEASMSWLEF